MFAVPKQKMLQMEIEKVIRILTVILVIAAFAVKIATRLLFPDASNGFDLPIAIVLLLCITNLFREPSAKKDSNK